ncbi:MAG: twitching motility protein [Parcubacteria group bacterium GW2011_GWA1_49_11]|uniref:Type IV pili twitching motility protein PilT n=1 Tax=Candidatus Yanofskybacteria bacterium RIFCSPHIGHO2_01_FULL_48_25b TaxID=1802672 RepID=A0A1F8F1M3_9BACT|nr:MAG: twitching motility protein [Parcubacteria group bacterium GW2011_GWA1_49_11]OGN07032.1 MAG: type IV pili twitching motility protein PilT [Candidatus Yanofskybacteria bacterium RIFCSPHIGHO2_01_FULL_48_25b]
MENIQQYIKNLLDSASQNRASDLHLSPETYPTLRIDGRLVSLSNSEILRPDILRDLVLNLLGPERQGRFLTEKELDFSLQLGDGRRYRVNAYQTEGSYAAALHLIPAGARSLEELNLPPILRTFTKLSQGFVLVVGPTGHGKTATLACLINIINKERAEKIITIEDPIEYQFKNDKSIIDQREIYQDTLSFNRAVRSALRENVNVIMISDLRDHETMSAAVTAAETGHLVFASLHTISASQTVERIINSFPADRQYQIRNQLAATLSGVISQRLIPRIQGGVVPAAEVMIANTAIRTHIRDNETNQIDQTIETSQDAGMISMDRSLANLVRRKEISLERAEFYSVDPRNIRDYGV